MVEFRTKGKGSRRKVYPISRPKIVSEHVHVSPTKERRHKTKWHVKGHYTTTRSGNRVWIKPHEVHAHEKTYKEGPKNYERKEIRFGGHFDEVAAKIAREYENKGYSKEEAERIGRATAAGVYRSKLAKAYQ
ncbi:MAG: hypothetical protein QW292_12640 [Candidatus Parvarchaeota archaeon]